MPNSEPMISPGSSYSSETRSSDPVPDGSMIVVQRAQPPGDFAHVGDERLPLGPTRGVGDEIEYDGWRRVHADRRGQVTHARLTPTDRAPGAYVRVPPRSYVTAEPAVPPNLFRFGGSRTP